MSCKIPAWLSAAVLPLVFAISSIAAPQRPIRFHLPTLPSGWRLSNAEALKVGDLQKWGDDPALDHEYGVQSVEHRTYRLKNCKVDVLIEEAHDPSSAYGLLTIYQTNQMHRVKGIPLALEGPNVVLMARRKYFVKILLPKAPSARPSESDLHALVAHLAGPEPSADELAKLPTPLPVKGLVPRSERYILGPKAEQRVLPNVSAQLIGFSQGAEVQAGTYKTGRGLATLVTVSYPTPQIAHLRFKAMKSALAINQEHSQRAIFGRQKGSFVFLVLGTRSPHLASKLMSQFKVSETLSWDQRYPGNKTVWYQVAELVLANLALVGILILLAILGGFLIFISRRIAAKWFPHSPWGHPGEGTFIKLNLG